MFILSVLKKLWKNQTLLPTIFLKITDLLYLYVSICISIFKKQINTHAQYNNYFSGTSFMEQIVINKLSWMKKTLTNDIPDYSFIMNVNGMISPCYYALTYNSPD